MNFYHTESLYDTTKYDRFVIALKLFKHNRSNTFNISHVKTYKVQSKMPDKLAIFFSTYFEDKRCRRPVCNMFYEFLSSFLLSFILLTSRQG